MGLSHLLDSDVLIQGLRGPGRSLMGRLAEHSGRMAVSTISLAELTHGAYRADDPAAELAVVDDLLAILTVVPFDEDAAAHAGQIRAGLSRSGTPIGAYDALIAGQARSRGLVVATGNVREFKRVPGLLVENWR